MCELAVSPVAERAPGQTKGVEGGLVRGPAASRGGARRRAGLAYLPALLGAGAVVALLLVLVGIWSIRPATAGLDGSAGPAKQKVLVVVATTGMIADAARMLARDRASVTALMGEGVDPHLYKASPGDMRRMLDADLVLFNGLHLEGRMGDSISKLGRRTRVLCVTDTIPDAALRGAEAAPAPAPAPAPVPAPDPSGHHNSASSRDHADPHVWFDVQLWMKVVEGVRDGLIEIDPPGREQYLANATAYLESLKALDAEARAAIASIPAERRVLVTAHDAFGYFGRAYGIEVLAIQGLSTDSEASLRDISALVETLSTRRIPAVFIESSVPRKTVDALVEGCQSRGHALRVGGELYSDAMGREGTPEGSYVGMVRHNLRTIATALGGTMPIDPGSGATDEPVQPTPSTAPALPAAPSEGGGSHGS